MHGHLYTSGIVLAQVLLLEERHKIFSYEERQIFYNRHSPIEYYSLSSQWAMTLLYPLIIIVVVVVVVVVVAAAAAAVAVAAVAVAVAVAAAAVAVVVVVVVVVIVIVIIIIVIAIIVISR